MLKFCIVFLKHICNTQSDYIFSDDDNLLLFYCISGCASIFVL